MPNQEYQVWTVPCGLYYTAYTLTGTSLNFHDDMK
jgi:hypothetical protein